MLDRYQTARVNSKKIEPVCTDKNGIIELRDIGRKVFQDVDCDEAVLIEGVVEAAEQNVRVRCVASQAVEAVVRHAVVGAERFKQFLETFEGCAASCKVGADVKRREKVTPEVDDELGVTTLDGVGGDDVLGRYSKTFLAVTDDAIS